MKNPKVILITGASSGLGAALALHYAKPGATLHLQGRNTDRLAYIADQCSARSAMVYPETLDVTDRDAMENWIIKADSVSPIDLIIANAGVSAGTGIHGENGEQARYIFSTNIDGVVNTVQPLLAKMTQRKHGQIAIMSSLAGIRGLPSSPAYSASKACVRVYGEGLRGWLAAQGVEVSVICPGYIKTPMTQTNNFPMPFIMTAEKAAKKIASGLLQNQARIAFPILLYLPLLLLSWLPMEITDAIFSRLPAKPALPKSRQ